MLFRIITPYQAPPAPSSESLNLDAHKRLIEKVQKLPIAEVKATLQVLESLASNELPVAGDKPENFFTAVFHRWEFSDQEKQELIFLSFHRGYEAHYLRLFTSSLISILTSRKNFASLLYYIYKKAIKEDKQTRLSEYRTEILTSLFNANKDKYAWEILKAMLETRSVDAFYFMRYIIFWFSHLKTKELVQRDMTRICEEIHDTPLHELDDDLQKLAKITILDILLAQTEVESVPAESPAREFLKRHRSPSFLATFGRSKSEYILDLIPQDRATALKLHQEERETFLVDLNKKLNQKTNSFETLRYR